MIVQRCIYNICGIEDGGYLLYADAYFFISKEEKEEIKLKCAITNGSLQLSVSNTSVSVSNIRAEMNHETNESMHDISLFLYAFSEYFLKFSVPTQ